MEVFSSPFDADTAHNVASGGIDFRCAFQRAHGSVENDFRAEILADFWNDVFSLLQSIGPKNSEETHECVIASESVLHLFITAANRVQLIKGFAQLFHSSLISGILKTKLFQLLGQLLPNRRIWKYVLTVDRELIQHHRSLELLSDGPADPLSCSKPQLEYDCEQHIHELKAEKSQRQQQLISDFIASQQLLFQRATADIESEISKNRDVVSHTNISTLVESITKPKMELLKNELETNFSVFKSNLDIDIKIAKEIEAKEKIIAGFKSES